MPNSFETDPRSAPNRVLIVVGTCFLLVAACLAVLAVKKSKGDLDAVVRVEAKLVNVGDGLPETSDVKFRGALVGQVTGVVTAPVGQPNTVHIALKPHYAADIPRTVTARVVPSNVFAVSSVQLVDNGEAAGGLRSGQVIHEDTSLPTVMFQSTLNKLRQVLNTIGRRPDDHSVGVLAAITEATHGRGQQLREAGRDMKTIVARLNNIVTGDTGPSTISALAEAADALRDVSPDLFNALGAAVKPMRTLAEKRSELTDLISAGLHTSGTLADAFDHQTDRLITITSGLTPVLGVLADNAEQFQPISTRVQRVADKVHSIWNPDTKQFTIKAAISLTPARTYVRADCPRYGALEGPSCQTAPTVPTAPGLYPALESMGYPPPPGVSENRPNVAPPRDSVQGVPEAPPPDPLPAESPTPAPPPAAAPAQPQSAVIGGNVGPVGSAREKGQLSRITGGRATAASEILLGPLARGSNVHIVSDAGGA